MPPPDIISFLQWCSSQQKVPEKAGKNQSKSMRFVTCVMKNKIVKFPSISSEISERKWTAIYDYEM